MKRSDSKHKSERRAEKLLSLSEIVLILSAVIIITVPSIMIYSHIESSRSSNFTDKPGDAGAIPLKPANDQTITPALHESKDANSQQVGGSVQINPGSAGSGESAPSPPTKAGCTYIAIPYQTISREDKNLNEGLTKTVGGADGSRKVCTDSNGSIVSDEITFSAVNKIVYYGSYTRDQALSDAQATCRRIIPINSWQSTDMGSCVENKMKDYGF